jgi:iron complex outermembrane receptor protein
LIGVLSACIGMAHADEAPSSEFELFNLEKDLEQPKVSSVTKSEQSAEEAPAIVDVITRDQIREWGYQSVAEVLSHTVGFYVTDDFILPNVAVRGVSGGLFAESSVIKVMVDGHSVAFRSTAGNWLGPEQIPISTIDHIEIIRGPASALYGADAFLGVVNIVTRSGDELSGGDATTTLSIPSVNASHPGSDLDVSAGFKKGNMSAVVGARLNQDDLSGLTLPSSSPQTVIPDYNAGHTTASGLSRSSNVGYAKLSYQLPRSTTITISGQLSSIDRGAEFAPWAQLTHGIDAQGRQNGSDVSLYQGNVDLFIKTSLLPKLSLTFDGEYFNGGPKAADRIDVASSIYYVRRRFGYSGVDLNAELQGQLPKAITVVAGVGFIYDREIPPASLHIALSDGAGFKAGDVFTASSTIPTGVRNLYNAGAYLQMVWTPIKKYLTLTGGVRYDDHNIYGSQVSGRLAAVSKLTDKLSLKLLFGSAFKAPSPYLLYAVPLRVGDVIGSTSLAPQHVYTVELEGSYRPVKFLSISTGLAYSRLLDAAAFAPQGVNQIADNEGTVDSLSWETKVEASYKEWMRLYFNSAVNYTVHDRSELAGYRAQLLGNANNVYPPYLIHLGVMGKIPRIPIRLTVEASYVGERRASEANILANGGPYVLPQYWLLDASISTVGIELLPHRETVFMVTARNMLGASGPDPGFSGFDYPLAPTTVFFQLRQRL